jgi:hypothetical protein
MGSQIFSFCFPAVLNSAIAGLEEAEEPSGESPPPDSDRLNDAEFGKNLGCWSIGL